MAWSPKILTSITSWSISRWAVYSQCAFKAKCKFVLKLEEPGSVHMDRGNWFHAMAEAYVTAKVPEMGWNEKPRDKQYSAQLASAAKGKLPAEFGNFVEEFKALRASKVYKAEQQWCFKSDWSVTHDKDWDNIWLRIKIDTHKLLGKTGLLGIDYKTGKRREEEHSDTLDLYALACFVMYPLLDDVTFVLWYLDDSNPDTNQFVKTYTRAEDFNDLKKLWTNRAKSMTSDKRFAPSPSRLCGWCHYSKAKGGPCKH